MKTSTHPAKNWWRRMMVVWAIACAAAVSPAMAGGFVGSEELPGELLVRLRSSEALAPLLVRHQLALIGRFGSRPIFRLQVIGNAGLKDKIDALLLEPEVLLVETNRIHRSPEARKNVAWAIGTQQAWAAQWAPPAIDLAVAQQQGLGDGIRVAVLDTGIDTGHALFSGRLMPGFDFVDGDVDPSEPAQPVGSSWGHGTHVAGIIATVAPSARLMPLRVLDDQGQGNAWVLAEALLHAVDPDRNPQTADGVHVINLSLGSLARMRLLDTIAQLVTCNLPLANNPANDLDDPGFDVDRERCARGGGAVIVAAAGNGASRDERQYPAAERAYGLVAVAASAANGRLASFSNFGNWIHMAAPGDGITSSVPGGWGTWSGTSMAAPWVAGAAALLRAREPALSSTDVVRRLVRSGSLLCATALRQLDVSAALAGSQSPSARCR